MPTIKECQEMVRELEDAKGFGHDTKMKLLWMTEEVGELVKAFKHNDPKKMAEETIDIYHFVCSILNNLKVNGDEIFEWKLKKNWEREAVVSDKENHFDRSDSESRHYAKS